MITCDRCNKNLTKLEITEMNEAGTYIACRDCATDFFIGERRIDNELADLREQRVGNWYNEWKNNKSRTKE